MPFTRAKPAGIANYTVCTSGTRPGSPAEGDQIYETNTDCILVYSGSAWGYIVGGPWIAVTFENSWVDYGAPTWQAVQYRKIGDIVYLRGLMKSGTIGQTAFTLPVGFRSSGNIHVCAFSIELFGAYIAYTDGKVVPTVGNNNYFSFSGTSFAVTV